VLKILDKYKHFDFFARKAYYGYKLLVFHTSSGAYFTKNCFIRGFITRETRGIYQQGIEQIFEIDIHNPIFTNDFKQFITDYHPTIAEIETNKWLLESPRFHVWQSLLDKNNLFYPY